MDIVRKILIILLLLINLISITFLLYGLYFFCIKQPLDDLFMVFYISVGFILFEILLFICFIIRVLYNRYNFYKQIDERDSLIANDF